jgi:hypothetical protein
MSRCTLVRYNQNDERPTLKEETVSLPLHRSSLFVVRSGGAFTPES